MWISAASETLISDAHHTAASRNETFAAAPARGNDHLSYCQTPIAGWRVWLPVLETSRKEMAIVFNQPRGEIFCGGEGITKQKKKKWHLSNR